jgi:hypothetical protein
MGVKATITTTTPTASHVNSSALAGRNISAMLQQVGTHLDDAAAKLRQIIADCPVSVSASTLAAAGSGYAAGNTITLPNSVVVTVNTVSSGGVATYTVTNAGSAVPGFQPPNPSTQVSTSGGGRGAAFNLIWTAADANLSAFLSAITSLS